MSLTEFDEEEVHRIWREDGIADGEQKKAIETATNLIRMNLGTSEQIAHVTGLSLETVQELAANLTIEQNA